MEVDRITVKESGKEIPLVTFANGIIKESRKRKLAVGAFQDGGRRKGTTKKRKIMVVESDKMTYKGENFGPSAVPNQPNDLYVAQLDKTTGLMTFFPAEVINMHPVNVTEDQVDGATERLESNPLSWKQKTDLLTNAFGSGKQKRSLEKQQRNKMVDGAVKSAMGSAISSAVSSQELQSAPSPQQSSSAIPPCNTEATTPEDVYRLHDILGPAEMESLRNVAQELCQCQVQKIKEWREKTEYPETVLVRMQVLPMDEERRLRQASLLLYLHYMMSLYSYKADQLRKKDPLPDGWPDLVKHMMLDRFTMKMGANRRCVPARLKDLLLSHILVVCLMVDNFKSPLLFLQKDLKVGARKLQMHVRALGCKVKSESTTDDAGLKVSSCTALLTLPLTFPDPSKAKKTKK